MKSCSDIDLKMHFIESQELKIQELASKNSCLKKIVENNEKASFYLKRRKIF